MTNARGQLDADHYGLEKIKKRLIEYLAVVRLKALQADREQAFAAAQKGTEAPKDEHPAQADLNASISALFPEQNAQQPAPPAPTPSTSKARPGTVKGPILL